MRVNFDTQLLDLDGTTPLRLQLEPPMRFEDGRVLPGLVRDMTLKDLASKALQAGSEAKDKEKSWTLFGLLVRIVQGNEQVITNAEATQILDAIYKAYCGEGMSPVPWARARQILDPVALPDAPKEDVALKAVEAA